MRNKAMKALRVGAAGAALFVMLPGTTYAAPVGAVAGALLSEAPSQALDRVASSRQCWRHDGVRRCGWRAERPRAYGYYGPDFEYPYGNPRAEAYPTGTAAWWRAMEREGRTGNTRR
jgi:hypothetical protein